MKVEKKAAAIRIRHAQLIHPNMNLKLLIISIHKFPLFIENMLLLQC